MKNGQADQPVDELARPRKLRELERLCTELQRDRPELLELVLQVAEALAAGGGRRRGEQ